MADRLGWISLTRKVVPLCLVTTLFSGGLAPVHAESDVVAREVQKRQARVAEAESLISEGDAAVTAGDQALAVNRFAAALERLSPPGPAMEPTRSAVIQKFSAAAVAHAAALGKRGDFGEANRVLDAVLAEDVAPGYAPAKTLKKQFDDPDIFNPAMTPAHADTTDKVRRLLILAQGHLDLGSFDEAKAAYNQVLAADETNTAARHGLETAERFINQALRSDRDYTRMKMLTDVDRSWELQVKGGNGLPSRLASLGRELPDAGQSRAAAKLDSLTLESVSMDDATLQEALTYIQSKSIESDTSEPDPGLKGINLIFNPAGKDLDAFRKVTLQLRNATLRQVLTSVCDLTNTQLSVSGATVTVEPLGVGSRIIVRQFRVPPGFLSNTASMGGGAAAEADVFAAAEEKPATSLAIRRVGAKEFLEQSGVPFPEGTSADYVASERLLIVRNTEDNVALVEQLVQSLGDKQERQVLVEVRMLKAEQRNLDEIGYDWLLGASDVPGTGASVFFGGGTVGNSGVSIDSPGGVTSAMAPVTAGLRGAFELQAIPGIDDLLQTDRLSAGGNASTRTPGILAATGWFTDPQFQTILRGLRQKKGVDLSAAQSIVIKSGQRATAASQRSVFVPTEFDPPQIPQSNAPFADQNGNTIIGDAPAATPVTPTTPQSFEEQTTGSSMEIEANISEDGHTVDLNLNVVFRELDGFINYGTPITTGDTVLTENRIIQPVFTDANVNAQVSIYDGRTIKIGGLLDSKTETIQDKVPVLGDLPFLGKLFRSDVKRVTRKAIVYFVTVKVVDPAGVGRQEAAAEAEADAE